MPQRNSKNGISTLRRSPRFLTEEDDYDMKLQVWKNRVGSPPIGSSIKTHSRSPLCSIENNLPPTTPRRSPRFLPQENQCGNDATVKANVKKNRVCSLSTAGAVSDSIHSSTASVSTRKTQECYSENITKRSIRSSATREASAKSLNGSRKSTGRMSVPEISPSLRRSPRFSSNENTPSFSGKAGKNQARPFVCLIALEATQKGNMGKKGSRNVGVQRSFTEAAAKANRGSSSRLASYRESIDREISTVSPASTPKGMRVRETNEFRKKVIRDKKRKQPGEGCSAEGWSEEQEAALRRAFFAAKPTPHFWKKVSKLVTGKSAQECFDKIHSDLITPPHPQPRSRVSKTNSSPLGHFSISGSKLLEPSEMIVKKQKKNHKQKSYQQKAVRHLLRKHYLVDEISEKDLSSCQKDLASPPVLKQVKNMALHDKYIDQLHCREARRKVASSSVAEHAKENHIQITGGVNIARNSLISDAQDVINKFKFLEAEVLSDNDDFEDEEGDDLL